ncbi:MAG: hypothetical protein HKL88_05445, partial [Bacteroidia bacterium]|nr:hypothetical protein [Bacteroidia bacterium]
MSVLCLISPFIWAQTSVIDSLKHLLSTAGSDSQVMNISADLCLKYLLASQYNESIKYGKQATAIADKLERLPSIQFSNRAKALDAKVCIRLGNAYENIADYPNSFI